MQSRSLSPEDRVRLMREDLRLKNLARTKWGSVSAIARIAQVSPSAVSLWGERNIMRETTRRMLQEQLGLRGPAQGLIEDDHPPPGMSVEEWGMRRKQRDQYKAIIDMIFFNTHGGGFYWEDLGRYLDHIVKRIKEERKHDDQSKTMRPLTRKGESS